MQGRPQGEPTQDLRLEIEQAIDAVVDRSLLEVDARETKEETGVASLGADDVGVERAEFVVAQCVGEKTEALASARLDDRGFDEAIQEAFVAAGSDERRESGQIRVGHVGSEPRNAVVLA